MEPLQLIQNVQFQNNTILKANTQIAINLFTPISLT